MTGYILIGNPLIDDGGLIINNPPKLITKQGLTEERHSFDS